MKWKHSFFVVSAISPDRLGFTDTPYQDSEGFPLCDRQISTPHDDDLPVVSGGELGQQSLQLRVGQVDAQLNQHLAELFTRHAARVVGVHALELLPQLVPHVVHLVTYSTFCQSINGAFFRQA